MFFVVEKRKINDSPHIEMVNIVLYTLILFILGGCQANGFKKAAT